MGKEIESNLKNAPCSGPPLHHFLVALGERNNCRHNGVRFRAFSVIWQAQMHIQRLVEGQWLRPIHFVGTTCAGQYVPPPRTRAPEQRVMVTKWHPPDPPWLKLNVKGSHLKETGCASGGGILRNHKGSLVSAFFTPLPATSDLEEEMEKICRGLSQTRDLGLPIWIETSSRQASAMIQAGDWGPANVRHTMVKIRKMMADCECRNSPVHHDGNKAATCLAQLGVEATSYQYFEEGSAPRILCAIVRLEQTGTPYINIIEED